MAYQQIGSFTWTAPDFIVNDREAMRFRAFQIVAGKHRNYQGAVNIMQASLEPWTEGEWVSLRRKPDEPPPVPAPMRAEAKPMPQR